MHTIARSHLPHQGLTLMHQERSYRSWEKVKVQWQRKNLPRWSKN